MIRGVEYVSGVPAAGHITTKGFWHPGALSVCSKPGCEDEAPPSRGANLMNNLNSTEELPTAVARTLLIGYTKVDRDNGYVPMIDGYRPGVEQHELTITVDLPPDMAGHLVAELVFIATNAPELEEGSRAMKIHDAIVETGYNGREAHWSLSVGDTVTVGGTRYACQNTGFLPLVESEEEAGK